MGGDLRACQTPQQTHVCVCGYPHSPNQRWQRTPGWGRFQAAVAAAQRFVAVEEDLQAGFAKLAENSVTESDLDALCRRVETLERELASLPPQPAARRSRRQS